MGASNGVGTTVVRRQLGLKLEKVRKGAGFTRESVGVTGIVSEVTLWRIEKGRTPVRPGVVWELGQLYKVSQEVSDALVRLAHGTRGTGWLEEYGSDAVPDWLGLYAGLEAGADSIDLYEPELVHGLFQTSDYARAIINTIDGLTDDVVKRRLAFRMERQRLVLDRPQPARLQIVLGMSALSLIVGSRDVMRAQIEHLIKLDERNSIDIGVLPWDSGPHPWMRGPFATLDFDDEDDPSLVHIETHAGAHIMELPSELEEYRKIFRTLQSRAVSIREYAP
jgi:transcriptional regulator with XRE-family HTH domain